MCQYTQTRYGCGHFHQGNRIGPGALVSQKCPAVLVALEYWHLQIQYYPVEQQFGQVITCPRACPMVFPYRPDSQTRDAWIADNTRFRNTTMYLGVNVAEQQRIRRLEAQAGLTGNHELLGGQPKLGPYPPNYYDFIRELAMWQSLPHKQQNVHIVNAERGCGCPGRQQGLFECLESWTFTEVLMFRMREWDTGPRTIFHLPLNYDGVQHPRTTDPFREQQAQTRVDVPMMDNFYRVMAHLGTGLQPPPAGGNPPRVLPPTGLPVGPLVRPPLAPLPPATVANTDESGSQEDRYPRAHRRPSSLPGRTNLESHGSPRRTSSAIEILGTDHHQYAGTLQQSSVATTLEPAASQSATAHTHLHLGGPGPSTTTDIPASSAPLPSTSMDIPASSAPGPSTATNALASSSQPRGAANSVEQVLADLEVFQRSEAALYGSPRPF